MHTPQTVLLFALQSSQGHALKVLRCLSEVPGMTVHVLAPARYRMLRYSRHYASFIPYDEALNAAPPLKQVQQAAERIRATLLFPVGWFDVQLVSTHRKALASAFTLLNTPRLEMFERTLDKALFAAFLDERGSIPHPPTVYDLTHANLDAQLRALPYPLLLKPRRGYFGWGIHSAETPEDATAFLATVSPGEYIAQGLVRGREIGCSVLCQDGAILAYTIQDDFMPGARPFGPAVGIRFMEHPPTLAVVSELVRLLDWSGIAHVDLLHDEEHDEMVVLEVNPRYWGSMLGSHAVGVNFPHLACRAALGETFEVPSYDCVPFLARRYRWRGLKTAFTWKQTQWPYLLRDPLPDLYRLSSVWWKTRRKPAA